MQTGKSCRAILHGGVALVALLATPALAEASGALNESATAARESGAISLDEVVVTANRRSQLVSDVGASVVALDGGDLMARGVASASDLVKLVPGFSAAETGFNVPIYSIRGVGFNDPSLASNATVAVSVDEVPLPYAAMTQGAVLDLQRLEVLKGPQGTLYGQNATGGAINHRQQADRDVRGGGGNSATVASTPSPVRATSPARSPTR